MTKQALIRKLAKMLHTVRERDEALRALHAERDVALYALYTEHRLKLRELAELSGLTIARVHQIVKQQEHRG